MNPSQPDTRQRILVVDDDANLTRVVSMILLDTGRYDVRVVNQPALAAKVAQQFRPHLVLLDVMMPGRDGGQVATEIRADGTTRDTPILFLTAAVTREEAQRGPIGGEIYLEKPVSKDKLLEAVARHAAS